MKLFLSFNRFSTRILLGFVALIIFTTLITGVPAFWLTQTQLERQAWSQVENAEKATQSLWQAEQNRLVSQLVLLVQRPTLQRLTQTRAAAELQTYLLDFQNQSGLDILFVCSHEGVLLAGHQEATTCFSGEGQRLTIQQERPLLLAWNEVVADETAETWGTAVVGIWLDSVFLQQLVAATGAQQSIIRQANGQRLTSTFAAAGSSAQPMPSQQLINVNGRVYYTIYTPLPAAIAEPALLSEVALDVGDLVITERRAFAILAGSTGLVILLGSIVSIWFVRQVTAPLQKLTAAAEKISRGDIITPIPIFTDPSEVHTLAAALQRSQASMLEALHDSSATSERLNTLLQSIVEGVVTCDRYGRITFWSTGAAHILGWPPEEALSANVNTLFSPVSEGSAQFLNLIPPAGQKKQISVYNRHHQPLILALTGSRILPPGTDTEQIVLVFRDVTEEESARQLRSYFLANISHEFRTPLSTLSASMELLLDEHEQFSLAEVRELLKPSHISLLSLQTLIDNLLESSSIEAGQFTLRWRTFHIHEAIEAALNIARPLLERRGQPFSWAEPPFLAEVQGDPARLTQVLVNLIINASKYSPINQPVELQLERRVDRLWVGVADHGPGIPPADRSNLFRSFVRLDTGDREQYGIGLGLYVVKTVVEAHGGNVGVYDRTGGGSVFWFEIPHQQE